MKKGFLHHFLIIGSGTAINMLIGFFTTPIITRLVDTEYYGQLSIFTLYSGIAVMILCLGLDQALVRHYYQEETNDYKKGLLFKCIFLPIIVCIFLSIVFFLLSVFSIIPIGFSTFICALLILNVLFSLLYRFCLLVIRLEFNSKYFAILNIIHKVAYLISAVLLILLVKDYYFECLAVSTVVSSFLCAFIGIMCQRKQWLFRRDDFVRCNVNLRQLLKYSLPLMVAMGISSLFDAIDKLSLQYFCTYSEVGVYTSALTLTSVFAIVQTTVNSMWGPATIEHFTKNPDDKRFYQRGNQIVTVVMFLISISLIAFKDIIAFLLGAKYREAAFVLPFLVFHPLMYTVSETTQIGISFMKKTNFQLIVVLSSCILNLVGNLILVPLIGQRGAAISTGIAYILFFSLRTILSCKLYPVNYKLGQFYSFTAFLFVYAMYNTFNKIDVISIIGYVIGLLLLFFLYKTAIYDGINYLKGYLKKKKTNES